MFAIIAVIAVIAVVRAASTASFLTTPDLPGDAKSSFGTKNATGGSSSPEQADRFLPVASVQVSPLAEAVAVAEPPAGATVKVAPGRGARVTVLEISQAGLPAVRSNAVLMTSMVDWPSGAMTNGRLLIRIAHLVPGGALSKQGQVSDVASLTLESGVTEAPV